VNELALFAGAGGGILGGHLLGWRTVCAVEWEPYPASVLAARQNDGLLPPFPIWDDIQTFNGRPWRGIVDVVSGGFPCQDISAAGKGAGISGERSGMWREMARIICEVRPRYAFIENSPMLTTRGLDRVLSDLASMGFDARWGVLGAADVGAPHQRDRIWIVAHAASERQQTSSNSKQHGQTYRHWQASEFRGGGEVLADSNSVNQWPVKNRIEKSTRDTQRECFSDCGGLENADSERQQKQWNGKPTKQGISKLECSSWWASEPNMGRMANGVAARVDRLKAIGNGQVPAVAATAFALLVARGNT
jgi:DNA (cytosine-5)-methyltransferase 1